MTTQQAKLLNFSRADYDRLRAEADRAHQYLDECAIGGDGTEPLLERIFRLEAVRIEEERQRLQAALATAQA